MKRILVVHTTLRDPGGATVVAAWVLEASRGDCPLTLLTWDPPDVARVNR